jgi:hypothetical protein
MTEQSPIPPPGGYPPPPLLGGSQSPSPGAVWPPPPGQPVDDLPTEAYTAWIRRVGAYLIDYGLLSIVAVILGLGEGLITAAAGGSSRLEGIVAFAIFSHGRYAWGWHHNFLAFLACVLVTTAVCVLIARGITRSVAARQEEEAYFRERKAARHWDGRQWTEQWR